MAIPTSPSTALYTLGKGILSIGDWDGTTPPTAGEYVDVGNCPSFEVEVTEESLDHYSSREGTRKKDKSVIIETGYTATFTLDEMSVKNLQIYLKATLQGSNVLLANTSLEKEYALKFVSNNPAGPDQIWELWRVKLSPNGAFSLIGEEWSTLSFTGEGLADSDNHPTSSYFNVTFSTTTA
jgi:hypothetical protein